MPCLLNSLLVNIVIFPLLLFGGVVVVICCHTNQMWLKPRIWLCQLRLALALLCANVESFYNSALAGGFGLNCCYIGLSEL